MSAQQHEQARYYLHIGRDQLNRDEQTALETHLAECAVCRVYAADLADLQGHLVRVMHARWSRYSPGPDLSDGARTRLQRRIRQRQVLNLSSAVPTVALILLVTVLGWLLVRQAQWAPAVPASRPATATLQPLPPAADDEGWPVLPGLTVFGDEVKLLGFALPTSSLSPGNTAEMTLYWQTRADNLTPTIFIHLLDADGRPAALVASGCSASGKYSAGIVATCLSIPLPEQLVPGPYQLVVGVYDQASGQRLATKTGQVELALTTIQVDTLPIESPPPSPTPTSAPTPTPFPIPPNCPVTLPNGSTPPGEQPYPTHHGNGRLWTTLLPDGVLVPPENVRPGGKLTYNWWWWRGQSGQLTIEGRRLDVLTAPPLETEITPGFGDSGYQDSWLIFPTEGCWEVTGKVGDAELTFVVFVVKVDKLP